MYTKMMRNTQPNPNLSVGDTRYYPNFKQVGLLTEKLAACADAQADITR